jgi:hypothetical protein
MDQVLHDFDFTGIHDKYDQEIKNTCMIFQHMTFAPDAQDWKWLRIKGLMVQKPEFDYYIHKIKSGINVQVMHSGEAMCYRFGVLIYIEDEKLNILPYMNGHID